MSTNVHTEHCCVEHGCKYGDETCMVELGLDFQSFPCEFCDFDREQIEMWLTQATEDQLWDEIQRRGLDWGPPPVA